MFLRRLYDDQLAQSSYLLGCEASGTAIVIDANRDVEQYVAVAAAEGARITHVTETHIHADFVSGSREVAERTGAELLLSDEGGPDWRYAFAPAAHARPLRDGDRIVVGALRLDVLHTPGHTPEHLVFVVTDTARGDAPVGMFSGDFLFVADVGRPDLLERAAHVAGTMEASAHDLFRSLQRIKTLPDHLQVWPGHGAGSACGKALSAVPQSTLGYERICNWGLAASNEEAFVADVLAGQPDPPRYFAAMKRINRDGPARLGTLPHPPRVPAARLADLLERGALVVDVRHAADFGAGHVPGTLNIPFNRAFATWAGSVLPFDAPLYLIDDEESAHAVQAARALALIGFDRVQGAFGTDALADWEHSGRRLETLESIELHELRDLAARRAAQIVDVRGAAEWTGGHLAGARHIPLGALEERIGELPRGETIVVHCQGGTRSPIAASILQAHGFHAVRNFAGGVSEWTRSALPLVRDDGAAPR